MLSTNAKRAKGRSANKTKAKKKERGTVNMLNALRDFAGCVEGPRDLATNKKYLETLGR